MVLPIVDADGPSWIDKRIAEAFSCRTKVNWASEMGELLPMHYAGAENVILVSDNLNMHTKGAFHEMFPPDQVRVRQECVSRKRG